VKYTATWTDWQRQLRAAQETIAADLEKLRRDLDAQGLEMVHIIHDEYEIRPKGNR
jgi:hypothetical protein